MYTPQRNLLNEKIKRFFVYVATGKNKQNSFYVKIFDPQTVPILKSIPFDASQRALSNDTHNNAENTIHHRYDSKNPQKIGFQQVFRRQISTTTCAKHEIEFNRFLTLSCIDPCMVSYEIFILPTPMVSKKDFQKTKKYFAFSDQFL